MGIPSSGEAVGDESYQWTAICLRWPTSTVGGLDGSTIGTRLDSFRTDPGGHVELADND